MNGKERPWPPIPSLPLPRTTDPRHESKCGKAGRLKIVFWMVSASPPLPLPAFWASENF